MYLTKYIYIFLLVAFCNVASAQQVGSKVSFLNGNGKTQTGVVTSIWFKHFKVKPDNNQSELWLDPNQISILKSDSVSSHNDTPALNVPVKNKIHISSAKDDVLPPFTQTSKSTIEEGKVHNVIGARVWVLGADGKTYTGTILDSSIENFKVKYDSSDDEAWADKSVFNFANTSTETTSNKANKIFRKGDKVEFDIYSDGSTWVRGTVVQVNTGNAEGCLMYKVNYDSNHNYNFHVNCKQIRPLNGTSDKRKGDVKDNTNKTIETTSIDTSMVGNYNCFQAIWDYNTKTTSWEAKGIITLNANGTLVIANDAITAHYEWNAVENIIKLHDGLEGAIAIPNRKGKNTEIKILFETRPAKIWSCSTHRN